MVTTCTYTGHSSRMKINFRFYTFCVKIKEVLVVINFFLWTSIALLTAETGICINVLSWKKLIREWCKISYTTKCRPRRICMLNNFIRQVSAVARWPARRNHAVDRVW